METSQRESLTAEAVEYLRCRFQDELLLTGLEGWETKRLEELEEEQLAGFRCILDALSSRELASHVCLERHADNAVAELRARIHQQMAAAENRTKRG